MNVLIAANVLKKNGKSVYCDDEINIPQNGRNRIYNSLEKDNLINKIVFKLICFKVIILLGRKKNNFK